jgi:hypothetical protein
MINGMTSHLQCSILVSQYHFYEGFLTFMPSPSQSATQNMWLMWRHTFQYLKMELTKKECCSDHLGINIKLILYKALIRSITIYANATWEYAVDDHLLKLPSEPNSPCYW